MESKEKNSQDYSDIFNMNIDEFLKEQNQESALWQDIYRPNLDRENVDTYEAILKFIPYYEDYTKSIISKYEVFLHNPETNESRSVDCPSTVREKSILQDVFFALRESPHLSDQELSNKFSRRLVNYSLVQIIKDKQHPELEGQIKIFSYGIKILNKIKLLMKPMTDNDDDMLILERNNPFDLFKGKLFYLKIKKVNNFQNYDESIFLDKVKGLIIDKKETTPADSEKILKFLKENSPKLTDYEYKPWDLQTKRFVLDCIKANLRYSTDVYQKIVRTRPDFFKEFETQKIDSRSENEAKRIKNTNENYDIAADLNEINSFLQDVRKQKDKSKEIKEIMEQTDKVDKNSNKGNKKIETDLKLNLMESDNDIDEIDEYLMLNQEHSDKEMDDLTSDDDNFDLDIDIDLDEDIDEK